MRLLTEKDIEVRVARCNKYGVGLLLYKNARVDMAILDEEFGTMGWKRNHQLIGDRLYCTVSVYDANIEEWVSKQDVGTESNTEPEKGQASDSFKRACFNWGIGRELYTAPDIWIDADHCNLKENNGKYTCYDRFVVDKIGYNDNREIVYLVINNKKTREKVFEYASRERISKRTSAELGKVINAYAKAVDKKSADIIKYIMDKYVIKDMKMISEAYGYNLIKGVTGWIDKVEEEQKSE